MELASSIYVFICIYITVFKNEEVINLRGYGEKQQKFEEEKREVKITQI